MYQALYRKWRPQTFDDVIGQKHITDSLKSQVSTGRFSHAYIFIGTRGTGKTTCARILAKAVNCENPVNGNPCCKCRSCLGIADGSIMDVVELDAASNNGVENVRALRDEAAFSPTDVKKRVYIIDEVHMLSTSAFNALLKIIEEPPEHLMFILATTELQKVPATILSRCQRHSFKRIEKSELCRYIEYVAKEENISVTHEAADLIAGLAEGGVRDALSMLDQCAAYGDVTVEGIYTAIGLAGNARIVELFDYIINHNTAEAVALYDTLWRDGKDPSSLLKELSNLIRDTLILKVAPKSSGNLVYGGYDGAVLSRFAKEKTAEELMFALDTLQKALGDMAFKINPKMTAELALISLCQNLDGDSIPELRARICALENAIAAGTELETFKPEKKSVFEVKPKVMVPEAERKPEAKEKPKAVPVQAAGTVKGWEDICAAVLNTLPVDMRVYISDPLTVRGEIEGDSLFVEVDADNEFVFNRLNKADVIGKFTEAANRVLGKSVAVKLRAAALKPASVSEEKITEDNAEASGGADSLDALRAFSEVKFE